VRVHHAHDPLRLAGEVARRVPRTPPEVPVTFVAITRWILQLFLVGNVAVAIYLIARPRRKRLPPKTVSPMLAPYRQPGEVMPYRPTKDPPKPPRLHSSTCCVQRGEPCCCNRTAKVPCP
jgi:hypothetical protein